MKTNTPQSSSRATNPLINHQIPLHANQKWVASKALQRWHKPTTQWSWSISNSSQSSWKPRRSSTFKRTQRSRPCGTVPLLPMSSLARLSTSLPVYLWHHQKNNKLFKPLRIQTTLTHKNSGSIHSKPTAPSSSHSTTTWCNTTLRTLLAPSSIQTHKETACLGTATRMKLHNRHRFLRWAQALKERWLATISWTCSIHPIQTTWPLSSTQRTPRFQTLIKFQTLYRVSKMSL